MKPDKEKIKKNFIIYSQKTIDFLSVSAKWIASIAVMCYEIASCFIMIKLKESKIKYEYLKLGKEAYNQWKNNKFFSLQEQLNKIKSYEILISELSEKIQSYVRGLKKLFEFKPEKTFIIVHGKKDVNTEQKEEQKPQENVAQETVTEEKPAEEPKQESDEKKQQSNEIKPAVEEKKKTPSRRSVSKQVSSDEPTKEKPE